MDLYKDQLKNSKARTYEYSFDRYFDQQIRELEDTIGPSVDEDTNSYADSKKNPLVASDNGGPPPPPGPIESSLTGSLFVRQFPTPINI